MKTITRQQMEDQDYGYPWGTDAPGLVEIDAACSACQEALHALPGHFLCNPVDEIQYEIHRSTLTESGWKALVWVRNVTPDHVDNPEVKADIERMLAQHFAV